MTLTLDQIEEVRQGHEPSLSLKQAADNVGLPYEECETCKGRGYTKATLLVSMKAIQAIAQVCPDEPVPIQYERCPCCGGAGGWVTVPAQPEPVE